MQKQNYEIEVLVNGNPVKEYVHDGRIYIEGKEQTNFSLRIKNNSWERKLFIPSIDGLSVMDGKDCSFDSSGYIVHPFSTITIDGWRMSDSEVAQFYFSDPKRSYSNRSGKGKANLGVIGVAVFSEVPPINVFSIIREVKPWPASDDFVGTRFTCSSLSASVKECNASLGTGWGDAKRSEVVSVDFKRMPNPDCVFEIQYNTRKQLEKLGINLHKPALQVSPQAFPGNQYCQPPQN